MCGIHKRTQVAAKAENSGYRLRRITTTTDVMGVELVSAYAGDRKMTKLEKTFIRLQQNKRGSVFFSDLFYAISHHHFAHEIAKPLWNKVLQHKHIMSERLCRNVRITVATLDYFSNITGDFVSPTLIAEDYVSEIVNLSMRDGMTGLYNHTSCYELLELEISSYRRYGAGVAVILFDIDNFKLVNDQHGHQEGDRILIEIAKTLMEQVRNSDICCRFGGDEFVTIMPFTSSYAEAHEIAERVRVATMLVTIGKKAITISGGVAVCDQAMDSPIELVKKADRALYRAKQEGKNRIV